MTLYSMIMKTFKRLEIASFVIAACLALMGVYGVSFEGRGVITGVWLSTLCFAYFAGGILWFGRQPFGKYVIGLIYGIFLGWAASVCVVGILFKSLLYEGWQPLLLLGTGVVSLAMVFAAIFAFAAKAEYRAYWRFVLLRTVLLVVLGIAVYLPTKEQVWEWRYADYPPLLEALKAYEDNPTEENQELLIEEQIRYDSIGHYQ